MITKLILTLSVIAIAWLVVRNRQQRMQAVSHDGRSGGSARQGANPVLKWSAYALLSMMLVGSGIYLYTLWQDFSRVVTVRVIDSRTGRSVNYQARRGDVGERHFITLDGKEVNVANNERIELESATEPQP
jgi:hypothetical protein